MLKIKKTFTIEFVLSLNLRHFDSNVCNPVDNLLFCIKNTNVSNIAHNKSGSLKFRQSKSTGDI